MNLRISFSFETIERTYLPIYGERSMAMTDNPRPYRNGPGGHRDAAADIAKMLAKGDKKKAKKKK